MICTGKLADKLPV